MVWPREAVAGSVDGRTSAMRFRLHAGPSRGFFLQFPAEPSICIPMHWMIGLLLSIVTVVIMEGVAYASHRWVMHGPGWFLHASHHRQRDGLFEANDLYTLAFALPSIFLLLGGVHLGWGEWAIWVGVGIAVYGAIYFGFHEVIVHRRIGHRYVPRSAYMKRIVQAHRLHHAVDTKHGSVSFGFLWAPKASRLKADLAAQDRDGIRAPLRR